MHQIHVEMKDWGNQVSSTIERTCSYKNNQISHLFISLLIIFRIFPVKVSELLSRVFGASNSMDEFKGRAAAKLD